MNAYFTLFLTNKDKTKQEIFTVCRPIDKDNMYVSGSVFEVLEKNIEYDFDKRELSEPEKFLLAINEAIPLTEVVIEKIIVSQDDFEELDLENEDTYQTYNSLSNLFDFYAMVECC